MPQTASIRLDLRDDPDFRVTVPVRRVTAVSGDAATYVVETDGLGTYVDDIDLGVSELPVGVDSSFAVDPIGYDSSTVLTVDTTGMDVGSHEFTVDAEIYTPPQDAIYADSCSLADVQSAIAAASPGATVMVPEGSATWTSQLVITKGILLIGAGSSLTLITAGFSEVDGTTSLANFLIRYEPSDIAANDPFRISGFGFDLDDRLMMIRLANSSATPITKVRLDHNSVVGSQNRCIAVVGQVWGCIDNNVIEGSSVDRGLILTFYGSNSTTWNNLEFDFGSAANMYVEDNDITNYYTFIDGGVGGRYCVRHNQFTYSYASAHISPFADMHGNGGPGNNMGGMGIEIYENDLTCTVARIPNPWFAQRGGKALNYNNDFTTAYTGSGGGSYGREEYLDSDNPPAESPISGQPQYVSSSYHWGNTKNGATQTTTSISGYRLYDSPVLQVPRPDRDIFRFNASFDGTANDSWAVNTSPIYGTDPTWTETIACAGIGVGLLAARPASCIREGGAYWATDEEKLYRWVGADIPDIGAFESDDVLNGAWELYYTPYTYPHPHRSDPVLGD